MIDCPLCDGNEEIECEECEDGTVPSTGEYCIECADGTVECPECGGTGQVES